MADVVDLIKLQHRRIDDLLQQAEQAEPDQVGALLQQVADLLVPHSEAETSFVYPAVQEYDRSEADELRDSAAEHQHVEALLQELLADDPSAPGFDGKLAAMAGELRHHVEQEETSLLPVLSEQASDEEREELGARFAGVTGHVLEAEGEGEGEGEAEGRSAEGSPGRSRKRSGGGSERGSGGGSSGSRKRSGGGSERGSGGRSRGAGQTREELYRKAKEKDIPGRSTMTKDELAEALDAES